MTTPDPLHVETLGAGTKGRPLVLVHGFGANNHFWRHWAPELARGHPVHMVELMGFGRAPAPAEGDYSPPAQSAYLVRRLRGMEGEPPVLVGHSLGGAVVLLTALRLMDDGELARLSGLVVVSGAVYPQRLPPYLWLSRIPGIGELLLAMAPPQWALRIGMRGIVHDPATIDGSQLDGYQRPLRDRRRRRAILRAARQIRPELAHEVAPRYGELDLPVLALWGAEDPVVPPEFAHRLEENLPRARAVLLPEVGHLPPEEAPRRSLAELETFLSGLEPLRSERSESADPLPDQGPAHADPGTQRDPEGP